MQQVRGFATHSRKSSTIFIRIRDGFATDSHIHPHNSNIFARVRDAYYTIRRVKSASQLLHVTRGVGSSLKSCLGWT
eukprot:7340039-Prymnesium_polylepis.1